VRTIRKIFEINSGKVLLNQFQLISRQLQGLKLIIIRGERDEVKKAVRERKKAMQFKADA